MNSKDMYIKKRHEFKRDGLAVSQIEHVISNYLKYLKKNKNKKVKSIKNSSSLFSLFKYSKIPHIFKLS